MQTSLLKTKSAPCRLASAISLAQKPYAQAMMFSMLAMTTGGVHAQDDGDQKFDALLEEIVITARRKDESLQDVPQTVNAVSADKFQELNILNFEDMQSVVPGVTLSSESNGYSTTASMRGIDFRVEAQSSASVEFYLNDAPVESNQIFTQMFDVGQVEVLRGPQGTLRGRSAPSGAITVRTREANLSEFGGYLNASLNNKGGSNYQGAINIPLVEDKLALRLAGVIDETEANAVKSVFSDVDPDNDIDGFRVTLGFAPFENFDGSLMHQRITKDSLTFQQHAGQASAGLTHHDFGAIDVDDRLSVGDSPNHVLNELEATTLNLNWVVGGHELSYVGQVSELWTDSSSPQDEINSIAEVNDFGGLIPSTISPFPGITATLVDEWGQDLELYLRRESHEIRITPEEPINDFFSYTAGIFYQNHRGGNDLTPGQILDPALVLGPAGPGPAGAYVVEVPVQSSTDNDEISIFLNGTFYLTEDTELSVGARHIRIDQWSITSFFGSDDEVSREDDEVIWNVALSHRFNDSFMMYGNVGTAVRPGPGSSTGVTFTPPASGGLERVTGQRDDELSTSYEVGFKWDFMDGRGRLNAAYYYQDFEGYHYYANTASYWTGLTTSSFAFTSNVDAKVQGVDLDASFQVSPNWVVSGVFAWVDSELDGEVPCDGPVDAVTTLNFCDASGEPATRSPDWTASLQSEYSMEVSDSMDGYIRGLYTYSPKNDNRHELTEIDSYGLLNLYLGVRDNSGNWDVQLFVKNLTDEQETTSFEDLEVGEGSSLWAALGSGYNKVQLTPRREMGISLRYNFGAF